MAPSKLELLPQELIRKVATHTLWDYPAPLFNTKTNAKATEPLEDGWMMLSINHPGSTRVKGVEYGRASERAAYNSASFFALAQTCKKLHAVCEPIRQSLWKVELSEKDDAYDSLLSPSRVRLFEVAVARNKADEGLGGGNKPKETVPVFRATVASLLSMCTGLQSISLEMGTSVFFPLIVKALPRGADQLTELAFTHGPNTFSACETVAACRNLTTLVVNSEMFSLGGTPGPIVLKLFSAITQLPKLQNIEIHWVIGTLSKGGAAALAAKINSTAWKAPIKRMQFEMNDGLSFDIAFRWAEKVAPTLEHFGIHSWSRGGAWDSSGTLSRTITAFPKLQYFEACNNDCDGVWSDVGAAALVNLLRRAPNLQDLTCYGAADCKAQHVKAMSPLLLANTNLKAASFFFMLEGSGTAKLVTKLDEDLKKKGVYTNIDFADF